METKNTEKKKKTVGSRVPKSLGMKELGLDPVKKRPASEAIATWIRALRQNWRQGTVGCKGRSDVKYSTKKPWKQKGTGRARAGSRRSPIWRGGGVTFGPQKRTKTLSVPQKVRKHALNNLLYNFVENGNIVTLNWAPEGDRPRTSSAFNALKKAKIDSKKIVLFLDVNDALSHASFANLPQVYAVGFDRPNAYDLLSGSCWVVLQKDIDQFKQMVSKWI